MSNTSNKVDPSTLPPCCLKFYNEKELYKRALHKERENRQLIEQSYKKLLRDFEELADLKSVFDVSLSSPLSSLQQQPKQKVPLTSTSQVNLRGAASSSNAFLTPLVAQHLRQNVHLIDHPAKKLMPLPVEKRNDGRFLPNSEVSPTPQLSTESINNERNGRRRRKMADSVAKSSFRTPLRDRFNDNITNIEKDGKIKNSDKYLETSNFQQKKQSLSFFVPLGENFHLNDRKAKVLRERSENRCRAIEEASRKRAMIVANRRAVASDIVKGKRQLDDQAKEILCQDSSKISAFPNLMKQMRAASRRKFEESPGRRRLEKDQQKRIEQSINRILSHASALR